MRSEGPRPGHPRPGHPRPGHPRLGHPRLGHPRLGHLRLGLIGLGRIGAFHAQTLTDLPAVASLVVTDAVPEIASEVADRIGAEAVGSPAELLASGVDGVLVAAATAAHPGLVRAAVDAGLPVFCEKPLAADVADAVQVARHVRTAGTPVQVGYPRRFDAGFRGRQGRRRERRARLAAHRALDDARPGSPAAGLHRRFRRHLPRLRRARLRRRALGDRARGGRGLRHRLQPWRTVLPRCG